MTKPEFHRAVTERASAPGKPLYLIDQTHVATYERGRASAFLDVLRLLDRLESDPHICQANKTLVKKQERYEDQTLAFAAYVRHRMTQDQRVLNALFEALSEVTRRDWLCNSRGSYPYNDDDFFAEAGYAFEAIRSHIRAAITSIRHCGQLFDPTRELTVEEIQSYFRHDPTIFKSFVQVTHP